MTNAFVTQLTQILQKSPSDEINLKPIKLRWNIDNYPLFCKNFALKTKKEIEDFFTLIQNCPLHVQYKNPIAYTLVSKISQYPEFKLFLEKNPLPIPLETRQSLLDQWIGLGRSLIDTEIADETKQRYFIRLLNAAQRTEELTEEEKNAFLIALKPKLPENIQSTLAIYLEKPLSPPPQSDSIQFLYNLYIENMPTLSAEDKETLHLVLHFQEEIALRLLKPWLLSLNPFPVNALKTALSENRISIETINLLIEGLPIELRNQTRINIIETQPKHASNITKHWNDELVTAPMHEHDLTATQLHTLENPPKAISKRIDTMQTPCRSVDPTEPTLGAYKAFWVNLSFKALTLLDIYRSFYTHAFGKLLNFVGLLNNPYATYYDERLDALKTILTSLDIEMLMQAEPNALHCLANCTRALADTPLLIAFAQQCKVNPSDPMRKNTYDSLLKTDQPFTSLVNQFTMSVRACL